MPSICSRVWVGWSTRWCWTTASTWSRSISSATWWRSAPMPSSPGSRMPTWPRATLRARLRVPRPTRADWRRTEGCRHPTGLPAATAARTTSRTAHGGAALQVRGCPLPGERLTEQLDAEIAGDQEGIVVLQFDLSAEALLVFGIVDPAGGPGVGFAPAQVAEDLRAADRSAASGFVRRILQPDDAPAHLLAAGANLDGALAGMIDPGAGNVGRVRCRRCQQQAEQGQRGGAAKFPNLEATHRFGASLADWATTQSRTCGRDAEKIRHRPRLGSEHGRMWQTPGISFAAAFTVLAIGRKPRSNSLYNSQQAGSRGPRPSFALANGKPGPGWAVNDESHRGARPGAADEV